MNIAYIVPSLANKGPIIVVKELVAQMVAHHHQCTVFYFDEKTELNFSCSVQKIDINQKINFSQFDIVHSHGMRPDKYVWKYREYGGQTKYISTQHNYVMEDFKYQYNLLVACVFGNLWMRRWLSKHDKIVALSYHAEEYYKRWFSNSKLTVAYNTRNPDTSKTLTDEELAELQQFKQQDILIGVNALLTKRKGVDILIRYLPELPHHKLFIVGNGKSREQLEKLAIQYGVATRCYFAGYKVDAYRYLPFYDVFALPSRSEGFPLALLEAAVYQRPAIASDIPVVKETFDSNSISIFEIAHPETVVKAITKATNNVALGDNLFAKYKECYAPEKMYQRYLLIYKEKI